MIFFNFIYVLLKFFYDSVGTIWGKGKPRNIKNEFDAQCISYLKSLQPLNDNDFIKATKPLVIGLVIFGFAEIFIASKIFGEHHFLIRQMVFIMMPFASLVIFGFLLDKKVNSLKESLKKDLNKWIDFLFKWTPIVGASIFTFLLIPEVLAGKEPTPVEVVSIISNGFHPIILLLVVFLLLIPFIPYLFLFVPILVVRVGLLRFMRWVVNKTLEDNNTRPLVIISLCIAAFTIFDAFFILRALM